MVPRFTSLLVCVVLVVPAVGRAEEGDFDSNGVKIHYVVKGKGEAVVLIHGFSVNTQLQWGLPGILKALAKNYRVIAPDCRGHGKSGKPTEDEKYGTEMVEDIVRLLDYLKIKKAHIVGYSMGALIAGKLLAEHPDRLLSVTLGGLGIVYEGMEWPPFVADLIDSLDKGKGIGPLMMFLTPPGQLKPSQDDIDRVSRLLIGENSKVLAAVVRGWKKLAVSKKQMKANKVPVLALVGENDPFKKNVENIRDRLSNLKIVVIDDTDHLSAFASPKFLNNLDKFLDAHRRKKKEKVPAGAGK